MATAEQIITKIEAAVAAANPIAGAALEGAQVLLVYVDGLIKTWKANSDASVEALHSAALADANAEAPVGAQLLL